MATYDCHCPKNLNLVNSRHRPALMGDLYDTLAKHSDSDATQSTFTWMVTSEVLRQRLCYSSYFNRAVTIHGVHNLIVEHNVIYDILGNAFFMENGIETGNFVRYNLPAVAAILDFGIKMSAIQMGLVLPKPSVQGMYRCLSSRITLHIICPLGLWIFPIYHPKKGGASGAVEAEPAVSIHSLRGTTCACRS
eukprot:gene6710-7472_t